MSTFARNSSSSVLPHTHTDGREHLQNSCCCCGLARGGGQVLSVSGGPLVPLVGLRGLALGPPDLELAAPGSFLAVQGVHGGAGLVGAGEVDEEEVVVAGLEALRQVRGDELADGLTVMVGDVRIMLKVYINGLRRGRGGIDGTYTLKPLKKLRISPFTACWSDILGRPPTYRRRSWSL